MIHLTGGPRIGGAKTFPIRAVLGKFAIFASLEADFHDGLQRARSEQS